MLAAIFISGGINALRAPEAHAQAAKPVLDAVSPAVDRAVAAAPIDQRPDDEMLIKIDAGVKIVAGTMLAFGKYPRIAAAALAASIVPTTLAAHRFWEETDPQRKQDQQIHFVKNVGLLGGLLIAAADTEGKPSLGWRGRRAAKLAAGATAAQVGAVTGAASDVTGRIAGTTHETRGKLTGAVHEAAGKVAGVAAGLAGLAPAAGVAASSRASRAGAGLSSRASELAAEVSRRAAMTRRKPAKRAKRQRLALTQLEKTAPAVLDQAGRFGHDIAARATAVGSEVAHQASGLARDARKRAQALTH